MYIQIVTFELAGVPDADYRRRAEDHAPKFAAMPGLLQKVWLGDAASNTYGGVYVWSTHEALQQYENSEVFAALKANPALRNVTSRGLEVIDEATAITSDLLRPVQ